MSFQNSKFCIVFILAVVLLTACQTLFAQSDIEPDTTIVGEGKNQRMIEIRNILPIDLNMEGCQRKPETLTGKILKVYRSANRTLEGFDLQTPEGRTSVNLDVDLYNRLCIACLSHFYNFLTDGRRITVESYACGSGQILWVQGIKEVEISKKQIKPRKTKNELR